MTLLMAALCCYGTIRGQDLARWELTNNPVVTFQSTHVNAGKLTRGNGITLLDFSPDGAFAHAWESSVEISSADYYEICIKPKPGYVLDISSLTFTEMRNAEGIRSYMLKWSLDGFETFSVLDDVSVPDNILPRTVTHSNLNIRICDGKELCFRWYGHDAESFAGTWYLSDIEITGTEAPACTPPATPPLSFTINNVTGTTMDVSWISVGADATIVLAREGAPVDVMLCGAGPYTADPEYGQGTDLGKNTFVVYNGPGTTFTMAGLKYGATYYLTALGYDYGDECYQEENLPVASATTLCTQPSPVAKLMSSPADGQVNLAWDAPFCYSQVLIVASEQPINSMPTSSDPLDYAISSSFSPGAHGSPDFTSDEALVYLGNDVRTAITSLNNNDSYHFRIYTFLNGTWAAGAEVTQAPRPGCSYLGGDFVYINELHFTNQGEDIDKGIEIAGQAGINLENYVLAIYSLQSNLERIINLSGTIDDEGQGYGAVWVPDPGLFFSSAIALVNTVTGVTTDFIAHRVHGVVANDGPAEGQPAYWQGQNEDPNTPVNYSIQRQGDIACPNTSQVWLPESPSSRGVLNLEQTMFPVTLLSFEGELKGDQVLLSWETETEQNNDFMVVEHSTDGRRFTEIGRVKGAGTTIVPQSYSLWHERPQPGLNYYRLKQVDFDGAFAYHGLIVIEYKGTGSILQVFPTLASERLDVRVSSSSGQPGELVIFDINGRPLQRLATPPGFFRQ